MCTLGQYQDNDKDSNRIKRLCSPGNPTEVFFFFFLREGPCLLMDSKSSDTANKVLPYYGRLTI